MRKVIPAQTTFICDTCGKEDIKEGETNSLPDNWKRLECLAGIRVDFGYELCESCISSIKKYLGKLRQESKF